MSRKRVPKQFIVGKDIPKQLKRLTPLSGFPNSYIDTYNISDGKFRSRRKFNNYGCVEKDYDVADNHKKYDHIHDFYNNIRLDDRIPTKKESNEIKKAKRKRKFLWKK